MRCARLALIAMTFALIASAEDAAQLQAKGIRALKEASPASIAEAARNFSKAAALYQAAGEREKVVEINSYLYWCKKKLALGDIEAFIARGEVSVVAALREVDAKKVNVNEAQAWFNRAETYARTHPNEHLLIAIRFFEVADRFLGSEVSIKAQERSLREQTLAPAAVRPAVALPVREAPLPNNVEVKRAGPVPDAASLKEAEKKLRTALKDSYAKTAALDKILLAKKLIEMSGEENNDEAAQYVQLVDARDLATAAADVPLTMRAIDKLTAAFVVSAPAMRLAHLRTMSDAQRANTETSRSICNYALRAADEAIAADEFSIARQLASVAEAAAAKVSDILLTTRVKDKIARCDEVAREWPAVKDALDKLREIPDSAQESLLVGNFYCFVKGDMERGLPALLHGSDETLSRLAEADLAAPKESGSQISLADSWWDLSQREKSRTHKFSMLSRSRYWYSAALASATGPNKTKAETRISAIAALTGNLLAATTNLAGVWRITWPEHPEYTARIVEFTEDGRIKTKPTDDFGKYTPSNWSFSDDLLLVHYTNGQASKFKLENANTIRKVSGDCVYTRQKN